MSQFITSTATATLRDNTNGNVVMRSKTLISSALEKSVQSKDIFGGKNAPLQFRYSYQKMLNLTLQDCRWDASQIALNDGTTVQNGTQDFEYSEMITLNGSGVGTLTKSAKAGTMVGITYGDSTVNVSASTTSVTYLAWANKTVEVVYIYSETNADYITINASNFPSAFNLTLDLDLYDASTGQTVIGHVQVSIPQLKLDGNQSFSFSMDNPYTAELKGTALADASNNYATIKIVRSSTSTLAEISQLWVNPEQVSLTVGATRQIVTYGYRGETKGTIINPAGVTYVSSVVGKATVSAGGLITAVQAGQTVVTSTLVTTSGTYLATTVVDVS